MANFNFIQASQAQMQAEILGLHARSKKKNFFPLISVKLDRPKLGTSAHFVSFCNFYLVTNFKTFLIFCEKGILGENFWLAFIKYIFFEYLIWLKALTLLAILVFLRKCRLRFMHIYCFNLPNFLYFCFQIHRPGIFV